MGKYIPTPTQLKEFEPEEKPLDKEIPEPTPIKKKTLKPSVLKREMPKDANPDNCIKLGDRVIEIKPTKLKYFRNKMAAIYTVLKMVPLNEFLAYEKGTFDDERNSDQILYDFLVAVFDDSSVVRSNYDEMTSEDIERVLQIFGRINHIEEKEEKARKNKEAQMKH